MILFTSVPSSPTVVRVKETWGEGEGEGEGGFVGSK